MARWKARAEFSLSVIELLFLSLTVEALHFGQWSYMARHVVNPSAKFEDPTAILSSVVSSDISHRIPLTGEGRSVGGKISGGRGRPLPIY